MAASVARRLVAALVVVLVWCSARAPSSCVDSDGGGGGGVPGALLASAFPDSVPTARCSSGTPAHACGASGGNGGITITVSLSPDDEHDSGSGGDALTPGFYKPGAAHMVELSRAAAAGIFRGYILTSVRDASAVAVDGGGDTSDALIHAGRFTQVPSRARVLASTASCGNGATVSHSNNDDRASEVFEWVAPPAGTGPVAFEAGVVTLYRATQGACEWFNVRAVVYEHVPPPVVHEVTPDALDRVSIGQRHVTFTGSELVGITAVNVSLSGGAVLPVGTFAMSLNDTRVDAVLAHPIGSESHGQDVLVSVMRVLDGDPAANGGLESVDSGDPVKVTAVEVLAVAVTATLTLQVGVGATQLAVTGDGFYQGASATVTATLDDDETLLFVSGVVVGAVTDMTVLLSNPLPAQLVGATLSATVSLHGVSSGTPVQVATVTSDASVLNTAHVSVPVASTTIDVQGAAFTEGMSAALHVNVASGATIGQPTDVALVSAQLLRLTVPALDTELSNVVVSCVVTAASGTESNGGVPTPVATVRRVPEVREAADTSVAVGADSVVVRGWHFADAAVVRLTLADSGLVVADNVLTQATMVDGLGDDSGEAPLMSLLVPVPEGVIVSSHVGDTILADVTTHGTIAAQELAVTVGTVRWRPTVTAAVGTAVQVGAQQVGITGSHFAGSTAPTVVMFPVIVGPSTVAALPARLTNVAVTDVVVHDDSHLTVSVAPVHPLLDRAVLRATVVVAGLASEVTSVGAVQRVPSVLERPSDVVPADVTELVIGGRGFVSPVAVALQLSTGASAPAVGSAEVLSSVSIRVVLAAGAGSFNVGASLLAAVSCNGVPSGDPVAIGTVSHGYPNKVVLGDDGALDLSFYALPDGVLFRLTASRQAWVGFGISAFGTMVDPLPTDAVIALPSEADANLAVRQYDLAAKAINRVTPDEQQDLLGARTAVQSGGTTTVHFKRAFDTGDPTDQTIATAGSTTIVWAVGSTNTLSYHSKRGSAQVVLACTDADTCSGRGACVGGRVACECDAGYAGDECLGCSAGFELRNGECVAPYADVKLRLMGDFGVVAGVEGSPERAEFEAALVGDLAAALVVPATRLSVVALESGSVIATIRVGEAAGADSDQRPVTDVVSLLVEMVRAGASSSNALYAGSVTSQLDAAFQDSPAASVSFGAAASEGLWDHTTQLADGFSMSWKLTEGVRVGAGDGQQDAGATIEIAVVYAGEAWVGVGFADAGWTAMVGTDAVIGRPVQGSVLQYDIVEKDIRGIVPDADDAQDLMSGSIVQADGSTVLRFSRALDTQDPSDHAIAAVGPTAVLWAYGRRSALGEHAARGVVDVDFASGAVEDGGVSALVVAHGALMAGAWAVLLPAAAAMPRMLAAREAARRKASAASAAPASSAPERKEWFTGHRAMALVGTLLAAVGAVVAVILAGPTHFNVVAHAAVGVVALVLALVQISVALTCRPPADGGDRRDQWLLLHRVCGLGALIGAAVAMPLGLDAAGAGVALFAVYGVWATAAVVALLVVACRYDRASSADTAGASDGTTKGVRAGSYNVQLTRVTPQASAVNVG